MPSGEQRTYQTIETACVPWRVQGQLATCRLAFIEHLVCSRHLYIYSLIKSSKQPWKLIL